MSASDTITAVRHALSAARMSTFDAAAGTTEADDPAGLELYAWNPQVSGALMAPLHICEVVTRNAVADAIEAVYGPRWPWSIGFEQSLPAPRGGYNPQRDLQNARSHAPTTGKAIQELKFVFWQKMFTSRHDTRRWDPMLALVMPNIDPTKTVADTRTEIYNDLEEIRNPRNRIAHHEPIISRDLDHDLKRIYDLGELRCAVTAAWMLDNQQASDLIHRRP